MRHDCLCWSVAPFVPSRHTRGHHRLVAGNASPMTPVKSSRGHTTGRETPPARLLASPPGPPAHGALRLSLLRVGHWGASCPRGVGSELGGSRLVRRLSLRWASAWARGHLNAGCFRVCRSMLGHWLGLGVRQPPHVAWCPHRLEAAPRDTCPQRVFRNRRSPHPAGGALAC